MTEQGRFHGNCGQLSRLIKQYRFAYTANPLVYPSDIALAVCADQVRAGRYSGACVEFQDIVSDLDMTGAEPADHSGFFAQLKTIALYALSIMAIWVSCAVVAKRLHDIGLSGWWLIIGFIPGLLQSWAAGTSYLPAADIFSAVTTLGFLLLNGFVPGTKGFNRYGPDPVKR